jgi:hypothetical protein
LNLEVFIFLANVEILNRLTGYVAAMQSSGPVLRSWAGPFPFFILFTAESFEVT